MALIEVTDTAQRVLGSRELAEEWLMKPALALDPAAVMRRLENGRNEAAKIIDSMKKKGVSVKLFGSMKTGKVFPNSDIDLLVTDCGPLDPEVVLVEIHAMEKEIPIDVTLLQFVPEKSLARIMESLHAGKD
jgi:predicted nucleotidyltransferase